EAASPGYDLVIVGTHGRQGVAHLIVGSVAERVVCHVDKPVLVARKVSSCVRRICVAVDFSRASWSAFEYGRMLAEAFRAELQIVHVIPPLTAVEAMELKALQSPDDSTLSLHDYARQRAHDEMKRFFAQGSLYIEAEADVRVGDPAREIVEAAKEMEADFIVMGTHGRNASVLGGMGSVAERVVRTAACSVLTMRWTPAPAESRVQAD
ncbi:MAG: universal stress protein, partial [Myxococcota bacterium]